MAQILWTVAIATVLHDVTVNLRMYRPHERKALMRRFHLAVWGAALFSALLPFTTGSYGSTGSWCWIEQTDPRSGFDVGTMWRYLVLYCPLWAGELKREGGRVRWAGGGSGGGRGAEGKFFIVELFSRLHLRKHTLNRGGRGARSGEWGLGLSAAEERIMCRGCVAVHSRFGRTMSDACA